MTNAIDHPFELSSVVRGRGSVLSGDPAGAPRRYWDRRPLDPGRGAPATLLTPTPAVQVTVRPGAAVTVVCQEGEAAKVAVVAGPVRVLIETPPTHRGGLAVPVLDDEPAVSGEARVYSLDAARLVAFGEAG